MQREILAPGGVLQLAPKQIYNGLLIQLAILNIKIAALFRIVSFHC